MKETNQLLENPPSMEIPILNLKKATETPGMGFTEE